MFQLYKKKSNRPVVSAIKKRALVSAFHVKAIFFLLILFYLQGGKVFAQVIINFEPAINGQTVEGLQHAKIINSTPDLINGALKIAVQDDAGNAVINIQTPSFIIHPGVNDLNGGIFARSKIIFDNSNAVRILGQTGRFPEGNYQYCFEFDGQPLKPNGPAPSYENCYNYYIQPYTPLLLINPLNQSAICNPRPDFSWQPPFPSSGSMRYRIIVAKIKKGQQPADALVNNLPVINTGELSANLLFFPNNIQSLVEGNTYAWQVTAYVNQIIVQRSEIWTFTYDCEKVKPDSSFDSYTEVNKDIDGNYYIADKVLKFTLTNPFRAEKLDYTIVDLADPMAILKKLPRINIQTGLNKIDLTLSNNKSFKDGHTYLMRINNISNHQVVLRFTYKE